MGRTVILVKHAAPAIEVGVEAAECRLAEAGRAACVPLAERLAGYRPAAVVSSIEPKTAETGRLVADRLGLPFATAPNLHEHDRSGVPFMSDREEWHDAVRRFFARPDALVLGRETANTAADRFARAVTAVLAAHPAGNLAIVAHGTVISLFVARHNPIAPFPLWERLGLPSFVVLSTPDFRLLGGAGSE